MMDYGPDWPPRPTAPAPARQRLDVPMLRPFGLWMRAVILAGLCGLFLAATLRGGYLVTTHMHLQGDGPHTTYATTTVHPVAGHGQPRHQPRR